MKLDWESVPTGTDDPVLDEELRALERVASSVSEELGSGLCIEVGSYLGKSTVLLAQFFVVMAVDLWGVYGELGASSEITGYDKIGSVFPKFAENALKNKLIQWDKEPESCCGIIPICSSSEALNHFSPLNAKFAFVDAEHTYPAAYKDLHRCARHLVRGGVIALHDVARPGWGWPDYSRSKVDPWAGNYKSYQEFLSRHEDFEVLEHFLGILFMRRK